MARRISVRQFRTEEGLEEPQEFTEFLRQCIEDGFAPAMCEDGCDVEPDGECEHGHPSLLLCVNLV